MNNTKFIDDNIEHIESDIEKIRRKPNMYISYLGNRGSLHLCKEIINNAIDECINKNSPADYIEIFLDENENQITVSDNGRGIPANKLLVVCTYLQSGSKFEREGATSTSAGENGVGNTACAALSNIFEIISYREGTKSKISFNEGDLVKDVTTSKISNQEKHGTTVIMKPSETILGKCDIQSDELRSWIEKIIYLIPKDIKIKLGIKCKGKEAIISKKYTNNNGLLDYIGSLSKKSSLDPIHFCRTATISENKRDRAYTRFLGLEVAFTYDSNNMELTTDSFCNFVNTIDDGVHVDAVKTGVMQYLIKQTRDSLSERESKKLDILPADVYQGLVLIVSLSTDFQVQFSGQTKEKVVASELFKPLKDLTYNALREYFNTNTKELKKFIDKIKLNAKARYESNKVRNSVIKGSSNNFEEHFLMDNFDPANNQGKNDYTELILIEGRSAKGSASTGRYDRATQAIFSLKGVPLNSFTTTLDKVLLNQEFNTLIKILGCNIGSKFDINKLKYNKIIIMADSDSDGYNITSLVCAFFIKHMPEIVKQGYLYKAVAPLYKIKSKYKKFILNKREFVEVFEKEIEQALKISDIKTKKVFTTKEMEEFLFINRNYFDDLYQMANRLSIHPILLEYVIIHYKDKNFKKNLEKKYPELYIDENNVLSGIYEGKYQLLIMDSIFHKRIMNFEKYLEINNNNMYIDVHEKQGKDINHIGKMSIGEFMTVAQKYRPEIIFRYKGLGELKPEELRDTTLDPNNRILIRLTIDDIERDLEQFNILHGNNSDERKLLMKHFKIAKDELDN